MLGLGLGLCVCLLPGPAKAQTQTATATPARAAAPTFEGTLGAFVSHGPEYMGSDRGTTRLQPGLALRFGRVSLATRSGFSTRREGDISGGVAVEVGGSRTVRGGLALRWDSGRSELASPLLAGMGDVRSTLRARLSLRWNIDRHWRAGAAWNADVLGRGGGGLGEVTLRYDTALAPRTLGSIGAALSFGSASYMQTNFGVTPAQSARSGYRVYEADAGWRDVGITAGLRHDIGNDWFTFGGVRAGRLIGGAADSPLTRRASSLSASAGLGWRF